MLTFKKYKIFLDEISASGTFSRTVESLADHSPRSGELFLKHDVETSLGRALKMAKIEADCGHKATYYIQGSLIRQKFVKQCIYEIKLLGHEVSIHYDVLDSNNGDMAKAIIEFEALLKVFDKMDCQVRSVCPHGNPTKLRSGWKSNKDFFKSSDVRQRFSKIIDIVVDFPKIFNEGVYFSDAGYRLRKIKNISDNDSSNTSAINDGEPIDLSQLKYEIHKNIGTVLSLHPHRFRNTALQLTLQNLLFLSLKRAYMLLKKFSAIKNLANKFHYLTRRF
jgi:hypothetical protein